MGKQTLNLESTRNNRWKSEEVFGFCVFNNSSLYFHHSSLKICGSHATSPCLDEFPFSVSITHISQN